MDYAWGKPVERVEHTGELRITKVVREIIDVAADRKTADVVH